MGFRAPWPSKFLWKALGPPVTLPRLKLRTDPSASVDGLVVSQTETLDPLEGYDAEGGERVFRRNLNTIAIIAGARGIPVTYLTMPFTVERLESQRGLGLTALGLTDLPDETLFQADIERFNAAILDAGSPSGAVDVVDMSMLMGSDPEYFVDVVHYSEQGILQFGRRLADELAPKLPQVSKGQIAPPSDAARRSPRCRS